MTIIRRHSTWPKDVFVEFIDFESEFWWKTLWVADINQAHNVTWLLWNDRECSKIYYLRSFSLIGAVMRGRSNKIHKKFQSSSILEISRRTNQVPDPYNGSTESGFRTTLAGSRRLSEWIWIMGTRYCGPRATWRRSYEAAFVIGHAFLRPSRFLRPIFLSKIDVFAFHQ